jgi:signal transduction histidine kinase
MRNEGLATAFAPPERDSERQIKRQKEMFDNLQYFKQFANFIPDPVLALNRFRQIVFANTVALQMIEALGIEQPYGLRPGEALRCEHARIGKCGCGTSSFCKYCGAVNAILTSLRETDAVEECRLTQEGTGNAFLFMVYTYPFKINEEVFSILVLKDISRERRIEILEHIFFHDIKNTLTVLKGWIDLLNTSAGDQTRIIVDELVQVSSDLIDEVNSQEQLVEAEGNKLSVEVTTIDSLKLLQEIKGMFEKHDMAVGRKIIIDPVARRIDFESDSSLLRRVLSNIVINALEAIGEGEIVTIGCSRVGDEVHFWIHNPGFMTQDIQSQIFKWSFSTKGRNRGLGTYGIRLLTERYLKGRVLFTSSPNEGTRFVVCYPLALTSTDNQTSMP